MSDLRVAVLGVGIMGADHVARLSKRISGAKVTKASKAIEKHAKSTCKVTLGSS